MSCGVSMLTLKAQFSKGYLPLNFAATQWMLTNAAPRHEGVFGKFTLTAVLPSTCYTDSFQR